MKILQINKRHYVTGGAETVYFNTCQLLTEHGHSVIHFSMKDEKNLDSPTKEFFAENFDLRNANFFQKMKNSFRFFYNNDAKKKLEQLIIQEKPDIAQIHLFINSLSVSIFEVLKKYNIPVVLTFHDYRSMCHSADFLLRGKMCENCKSSFYTNCFWHKCYQNNRLHSGMITSELLLKEYFFKLDHYVDHYLFVSDFQKNAHLNHSSYYKNKNTRLYNFNINLNKNIPEYVHGSYFFFYGSITPEKGIHTLIKAASILKDVSFKIAGVGPLLDELKTLNLPNVELLGFQTGKALQEYIKNAAFVIVPSEWHENNPLTIVESYMYGKPVIASKMGGIPEIVVENETGFLFPAKSVDDLIAKIQYAQSLSDEEYLKLSKNARAFAEKNFEPEQYYQDLMVLYGKAIDKKNHNENF